MRLCVGLDTAGMSEPKPAGCLLGGLARLLSGGRPTPPVPSTAEKPAMLAPPSVMVSL